MWNKRILMSFPVKASLLRQRLGAQNGESLTRPLFYRIIGVIGPRLSDYAERAFGVCPPNSRPRRDFLDA